MHLKPQFPPGTSASAQSSELESCPAWLQQKHAGCVGSISWVNDKYYLSASDDNSIGTWSIDGEFLGYFIQEKDYGVIDLQCCPIIYSPATAPSTSFSMKLRSAGESVFTVLGSRPNNAEFVALACTDGYLRIYNTKNGRKERAVLASQKGAALTCVRWSPDGSMIAVGSEDGAISIWSRAGMLRTHLVSSPHCIFSLQWSPNGSYIAWSSGKDVFVSPLQAEAGPISSSSIVKGVSAATYGPRGTVSWRAHDGVVTCLDWCRRSNVMITGGEDGFYKLWSATGALLSSAQPFEYSVTQVSWAPNGHVAAVGTFGNVVLVNPTVGGVYAIQSVPGIAGGVVRSLGWKDDSTHLAVGFSTGAVVSFSVLGRIVHSHEIELAQDQTTTLHVSFISPKQDSQLHMSDGSIETRDPIVDFAASFEHIVVATQSTILTYHCEKLTTPLCSISLKIPPVLVVCGRKGFALVDCAGAVLTYSYDGRQCALNKPPVLLPHRCTVRDISISGDVISIVETEDRKVVRSFELNGGRALGATPLTHSSPIHAIALSQCSASLAETLLILYDAEKNVYITPATRNSLKKVSSNVVSVLWSTSHDALLCLESGAVAMHLWPMAYLTAPSEAKHLILNVKDETLHENGRRLLWFHGSMASLQKKSGALKTFLVSNMAPLLLDGVVRQNWQDTIRLCRVISEKEFWYLLAVTSVGPKGNLEASEEALAALGHMDKLQHIRRIKDIKNPIVRQAEMLLYRDGTVDEAENVYLSAKPPLHYRAMKLNIDFGRWSRAHVLARGSQNLVDILLGFRSRYLNDFGYDEEPLEEFQPLMANYGIPDWTVLEDKIRAEEEKEAQSTLSGPTLLVGLAGK